LRTHDVVMKRLIALYGPCPFAEWEYEPFSTLVTSIISQQLSSRASDTIEKRIAGIVSLPFDPKRFLEVSPQALRGAGLSLSKVRYIRELAQRVVDGRLVLDDLDEFEDETVIATLVKIPGIGQWTAEMFLIFGLRRLDVLSLGDGGLRRAFKLLYGKDGEGQESLETVAVAWRPFRSVASWYLWKSLDSIGATSLAETL